MSGLLPGERAHMLADRMQMGPADRALFLEVFVYVRRAEGSGQDTYHLWRGYVLDPDEQRSAMLCTAYLEGVAAARSGER